MRVKYMAAVAAASVLSVGLVTGCGPSATDSADPCAAPTEEVDPCAADPCAADPCAAE